MREIGAKEGTAVWLRIRPASDGLGVDEDAGENGGLGPAVDPDVVRAALDPGFERDLALVQEQRYPPRDGDHVVDRRRLVYGRVARGVDADVGLAHGGEGRFGPALALLGVESGLLGKITLTGNCRSFFRQFA